jgi:hypothetical protein
VTSNIRNQCEAPHIHFPLPPVAFDHRAPNRRENTMMTELQIFTEVASSSTSGYFRHFRPRLCGLGDLAGGTQADAKPAGIEPAPRLLAVP